MQLTYALEQSIAIAGAAGYFDLHNCYQIIRVHREGSRCCVEFMKDEGAWVNPDDPTHLRLVFEQVTYFQLSPGLRFPTWLEHIGFQEPHEQDVEWLMEQPGAQPMHMVLMLGDEAFIRIGAATSSCRIGPPTS